MKSPLRVRRATASATSSAARWPVSCASPASAGGSHEAVSRLDEADFIIADADRAAGVALHAAGRIADTVFVGEHAPAGAPAWLPRPIDPLALVRELDALAARRAAPPLRADPAATAVPDSGALLVDDSAIALRHLQMRLQSLGVQFGAGGEQRARARAARRNAHSTSSSSTSSSAKAALDGLALCQHIKRSHRHVGGRAPQIVIVSAHDSELDRVRGTFAGCDAYLAKPLDEASSAPRC